jgi:uncharacterized protein with HEPN domain
MAGMRDVLIHQYSATRLEIARDTIHEKFPRDRESMRRILDDLPLDA